MKKRKDGRYATKIIVDGKTNYIYGYSVAEIKEKKMQIYLNSKVKSTLFKDVIQEWFRSEKSNLQYNTQRMYQLNLKYLEPLYNTKIDKVKLEDVLDILESLKDTPRTYNLVLLTLKQLFEYSIDENYCNKNIVRKLKPLKVYKKEKLPLTSEQIKLIEYCLPLEPKLLICYFLICTGLRREELIPLTYEDVYDNVIHINKAVYFEHNQPILKTTKNRDFRDIPILDGLKPYLNGTGLIFPNEKRRNDE